MNVKWKLHRLGIGLAALIFLVACAGVQEEMPMAETAVPPIRALPQLPNLGEAPEITNEVWINTDAPITLASQRGKVVLLEFWTFG